MDNTSSTPTSSAQTNGDAVLLINLGSPNSPTVPDVREYLREFLGDERVIDVPFVRKFIVPQIILRTRPKKSAEAYSEIWTDEGAPLILISEKQRDLLREATELPVYLAMRYGSPSIPAEIAKIKAEGVRRLYIMPLYPHYAMSSYETVVVRVMEEIREQCPELDFTLLQPFYDEPDYINALVETARPHLEAGYDKLLFSFHGVPERHLQVTDPSHDHCLKTRDCCSSCHPAHHTCYRHQCFRTVQEFVKAAGIPADKYFVSFQSRLGRDPWLTPYTDATIERFAKEGVKKLLVMCPAFVADCLETIEEIGGEGKEIFEEHGGEHLTLVPCLNDHPAWIRYLAGKVKTWHQEAASA